MHTIGLEWLMVFLYVGMLGLLASESEFKSGQNVLISVYQVLMSFQDMMMIGY